MARLVKLKLIARKDKLFVKLSNLGGKTKEALGIQVGFLGRKFRKRAIELAPIDTGRLRSSIHLRKVDGSEYRISAETPYAIFQEKGVRPHFVHKDMLGGWDKRHPQVKLVDDRFLFVGGKNSRIRKGSSRNAFIRKSFDQLINEGAAARAVDEVKNAIIKEWNKL